MTTQFSPELHGQYKAKAYSAANAKSHIVPFTTPRRNPGEHDVQIEILFCGTRFFISLVKSTIETLSYLFPSSMSFDI
jgi:hypothetical protein